MKTRIFSLAIITVLLLSAGCKKTVFCIKGSGSDVTQTLDLPSITGFKLMGAGDVYLHKGEGQEVTVTGPQNLIDNIVSRFQGNTWVIDQDRCERGDKHLRFDITIPVLEEASISGSGNVYGMDTFTDQGGMELNITGSGNMELSVEATTISSTITGSGNITLDGTVNNQTFDLSGSGNLNAFGLASETADIEISGSGDAEVTVSNSLDVKISGSGNVYYKGDPVITSSITGSGNVINSN